MKKTKRNSTFNQSTLQKLFTSSFVNIVFPVLLVYHTVLSIYIYVQELILFKRMINENDDLVDRLMSLDAYSPRFRSIIRIRVSYAKNDEQVQLLEENVRRNTITLLDNMITSYELLGIIKISIRKDYRNREFIVDLKPANSDVVLLNLKDLLISSILYVSVYVLMKLYVL